MGQKWLMYCSQIKPKMMKKQTSSFLGIDVSKEWFDISLMAVVNFQKQPMITERFDNTIACYGNFFVKTASRFT